LTVATSDLALLYARVSTAMQANDGMSLDAQERELRRAAELAGFTNVELLREEGRSGKSISGRPVLRSALERLDTGEAAALFVTRLDRLARSTKDFLSIIDRANTKEWRIVLLDLNLDTSSYQGRFVLTVMSALAEMERAIIAERQKDVHKERRALGKTWGVDLGPKTKISVDTRKKIVSLRDSGMSYSKIADYLNSEEIQTTHGGKWFPSTVYNLVNRLKDDDIQ